MKKDIIIYKSFDVKLGLIQNEEFWDLYLLNYNCIEIKNCILVISAISELSKTSTLRYFIEKLKEMSAIKIESISKEVMNLNNELMLSFFIGEQLYEQNFTFNIYDLNNSEPKEIELLKMRGHIIE